MATKKELKLRHQILTPQQGEDFEMDVYALKGLWLLIKETNERKEALMPELKGKEFVGKVVLALDPELAEAFQTALHNTLFVCTRLGYDPNALSVKRDGPTEIIRIGVPPKEKMA